LLCLFLFILNIFYCFYCIKSLFLMRFLPIDRSPFAEAIAGEVFVARSIAELSHCRIVTLSSASSRRAYAPIAFLRHQVRQRDRCRGRRGGYSIC